MGCTSSAVKDVPAGRGGIASVRFHSTYILGKRLGQGAYGQVRLAIKVDSKESNGDKKPEEKAVKVIDMRDDGADGRSRKKKIMSAHAEAEIGARASSHTNCVHVFETFIDVDLSYLIMEKCDCGLFQYLDQLRRLDERSLGSIFVQMLQGIAHMHSMRVVHRDVKPNNFMVGGSDGQTIKLGDFGLSKVLPQECKMFGIAGTAPFMCPEMIRGEAYDEKADVWSMAVLAYALLFGSFPYKAELPIPSSMKKAVVQGLPPRFQPDDVVAARKRSDGAVDFVKDLLERNPVSRLSAQKALNLEFLADMKGKSHMQDKELPSLRPELASAKRAGAFATGNAAGGAEVDRFLSMMQVVAHGKPLPEIEARQMAVQKPIGNLLFRSDAVLDEGEPSEKCRVSLWI